MWPWSTIKFYRERGDALFEALGDESRTVGNLQHELQAAQRAHSRTQTDLETARNQREDVRVSMDNALRDIAVEQEATRQSQLDLAQLRKDYGLLNSDRNAAVNLYKDALKTTGELRAQLETEKQAHLATHELLAKAQANDARDEATGKYVRQPAAENVFVAPTKRVRKRVAKAVEA